MNNEAIRLGYYRQNGFTEDAKNDSNQKVRLGYYRQNGFCEDAKNDESTRVRNEAIKALSNIK